MNNHEITLPLLNAVIESGIENFDIRDNTIYYTSKSFLSTKEMNLDTFCFRCIDWMENEAQMFDLKFDNVTKGHKSFPIMFYGKDSCFKIGDTPQQAIIKATLWVLGEKVNA